MGKFGNFRESRSKWTKEARDIFSLTQARNFGSKVEPKNSIEEILANLYGENEKARAIILARMLLSDIHNPDVYPYPFRHEMLKNRTMSRMIGRQMKRLLNEYGNRGFIYSKENHLEFEAERVKGKFFLADNVGMPLKDFLIWHKGSITPNHIISEWSGIPADRVNRAYDGLIEFFDCKLKSYNQEAEKSRQNTSSQAEY